MKIYKSALLASAVLLIATGLLYRHYLPEKNTCAPPNSSRDKAMISKIHSILPQFTTIVKEAMEISHVPGLSLAIVYRNKIILVKGFGKKNIDTSTTDDVDADTIFQIASLSKPYTTSIIASLITQGGGFSWNTPIVTLDPDFSLSDPKRTQLLTIGDLLSHQSGLPDHAGDFLEDLGYSQPEIIKRLRYIKPLDKFREKFIYTNFGFSEAAFAIARSMGTSWDNLAQTFFTRLGMPNSSYRNIDYRNAANKADIHIIRGDKVSVNAIGRNADNQAPAGGLSTNAKDAAKWLMLILNDGCYENKKIINKTELDETQKNHQYSSETKLYGYGWNVTPKNNETYQVSHSGLFSMGVRSAVTIDKNQHVAIIIFSNAAPSGVPELLTKVFFSLLQGESTSDWKDNLKKYNEYIIKLDPHYELPAKKAIPPASLQKYTGIYFNEYFGNLIIKDSQNCDTQKPCLQASITTDMGTVTFDLIYHSENTFYLKTIGENETGYSKVTFSNVEHREEVRIDAYKEFNGGVFIKNF